MMMLVTALALASCLLVAESGSNSTCGKSPLKVQKLGRIVGGTTVQHCSYIPWQVRLKLGNSLCGGSVLSRRHILTAAHCTYKKKPGQVIIYLADSNMHKKDAEEKKVAVTKIIEHDDYNPFNYDSDVAVLVLKTPIQDFNECVQPICLDDDEEGLELHGHHCVVSGWGTVSWLGDIAERLQMVTLKTYRGKQCREAFKIPGKDYIPFENKVICAGEKNKDSCQGDSGGPLVCKHPTTGNYVQVGVVSYGRECALHTYPGVYASVHQFSQWIKDTMEKY